MSAIRRSLTLLATGTALVASLGAIQIPLSDWSSSKPKHQQLTYLPSGVYLRMASLGYRELVADLLWLQAIQMMGERKLSEEAGHWLYQALDRITTIDPKFIRVYEAGGHALCTLVVLPEKSIRLLEKGMQHNPQEWKLPFILGINYYFELADDEKAAEAMAKAARLPGAPEGLARLAAKLFVSARSPQQAVDLLAKAYEETSDENVRTMLETRLKESIVERDLQLLEEMISRYQGIHFRLPEQLENIVESGLLRELPREPFGGRYLYEPTTGAVHSSEVTERMRITVRRRGQYQ
jgi:tetratricopeptide (TPR) repeat protein